MNIATGKSTVETNRRLRDAIPMKCYEIVHFESAGGEHKSESRRRRLADGVIFLQSNH
jgi:hypothetical protein